MTDHLEAGDTHERNTKGRSEEPERQDRPKPPFTGHPPIIIPDGLLRFNPLDANDDDLSATAASQDDILVQFDGEDADGHRHYTPEAPPTYRARTLHKIDFIRVEDGSATPHFCTDVPPNCRIVVKDQPRRTGSESSIEIDATRSGGIRITFSGGRYERKHKNGKRKMLLGGLKKIKSMEVFDSAGKSVHTCPKVGPNKDVRITICDDRCRERRRPR